MLMTATDPAENPAALCPLRGRAAIVTGSTSGICLGVDADGLVKAGVPGIQLTGKDAKIGGWAITPPLSDRLLAMAPADQARSRGR